jgi:hypothetical protein
LPSSSSSTTTTTPSSPSSSSAAGFDAVFTQGWLGAWPERGALAARLAGALRPGGLLVGDEHVGRADGRPAAEARALGREVLELFQPAAAGPRRERWREALGRLADRLAAAREPSPPEQLEARVEAFLGPRFRVVRARSQGGALLQRVLATAAGRIDPESPEDQSLLAILAYLEELLERGGVLAVEHACFVAERI